MHISQLSLVNFRNFRNARLKFSQGINTIIGENGSGKTNLFRAVRLLLDDNLLRYSYGIGEKDFCRGIGDWRGHWIIISIEFQDLAPDEAIQSLFLHGAGIIEGNVVETATYNLILRPNYEIRYQLSKVIKGDHAGVQKIIEAISIEEYETIFTGKSDADFNDMDVYKLLVGDFENADFDVELENPIAGIKIPHQLSVSREISFTFVKALRDVVSDFQNNRTNPLLKLLRYKSDDIEEEKYNEISKGVRNLNELIEKLDDVRELRDGIRTTIQSAAGEAYSPKSLSIKSSLSEEAEELFQSLKLFIGESEEDYEGAIHELSLGGANLIYLTLKLLEFKYQKAKKSFANFLLIEEPEAHIHTHIQKTLFHKLDYGDTQIIYSTHSTHISEVSNVSMINVLAKKDGYCEAYQPSTNLTDSEVTNLQRYLDAVRSNLLFAKSILLIEGDAEEIMIPMLAKKILGVTLDELGISLINIRSTGFTNVATIFHDDRVRRRCAIVTDLDESIIDVGPVNTDGASLKKRRSRCRRSQELGASRKIKLDKFSEGNHWIKVFYAPHTFEVDFVAEGNSHEVIQLVDTVYTLKSKKEKSVEELESGEIGKFGQRALRMANNLGKGWFAVELSNHVDYCTYLPKYIWEAILFAHGDITRGVWANILDYRVSCLSSGGSELDEDASAKLRNLIAAYRESFVDLNDVIKLLGKYTDDDPLCRLLSGD